MKKLKIGGAVAAVCLALGSWASSLEVTDVKIAQRYPWNGLVDITYTVKSDDPNKDVWVYPVGYDADRDVTFVINPDYLSGEGVNGSVKPGSRHMVWNMAAQMGKNYNRAACSVTMQAFCDAAPYMVIDLSAGSDAEKYDVSYLPGIPEGGWTDEYKTTKMVFRLILPGRTGPANTAFLTSPYYFAIFPLTSRQYSLIVGGSSSSTAWAGYISYNQLRGDKAGAMWPQFQQVDGDSILGKLRIRTGITIDLPTQAQWYRATTVDVNNWGIMGVGEIGEWCRDWGDGSGEISSKTYPTLPKIIYPAPAVGDYEGPSSNVNKARVVCGRIYLNTKTPSVSRGGCEGYCTYCLNSSDVTWGEGRLFTADCTTVIYCKNYYENPRKEGLGARLVALPMCK